MALRLASRPCIRASPTIRRNAVAAHAQFRSRARNPLRGMPGPRWGSAFDELARDFEELEKRVFGEFLGPQPDLLDEIDLTSPLLGAPERAHLHLPAEGEGTAKGEPHALTRPSVMMPPRIDVHVEDSAQGKRVIVHADVPGIPKENVRLTLSEDNVLCISGERREERGEPGSGHYERSFGTFRRMVRMPGRIDRNKIDAKMEHGVLRLEVPLVGPSEEHQIEIK